ncbi:HAMP domain-containing sensor histidine kinase [Thioalkalicoccus limnaeus]|uniref:histidine kinase n=1 Tax=Thioalkalicoccus limnaeus TaxID=120681 RepID=A0ABV4BEB2_9GAMM
MPNRFSFYRLLSLAQLSLFGFAVASMPLLLALMTALISVDRLTFQGQHAVREAAQAIQLSRELAENATNLERYARQYQVLGDAELLESYRVEKERFFDILRRMDRLDRNWLGGETLAHLESDAHHVFNAWEGVHSGDLAPDEALQGFLSIARQVRNLFMDSVRAVPREIEVMRENGEQVREQLLWQTAALIPAALILAAFLGVLIAKPMRQLKDAIESLGVGRFDRPIDVKGPNDLAVLGRHLDRLRMRLAELDEQRTFFLQHVSHELKTPLTSIREGAEILTAGVVGRLDVQQQEIAEIIKANSLSLQEMIESLLRGGQVDNGGLVVAMEPLALDDLITDLAKQHELAARVKDVKLDVTRAEVTLCSDRDKLRTLLDNLLSNAVSFTIPRGWVRIETRVDGDQVIIEVRDQGPGIAPEDRERIFEPFFQGKNRASGPNGGTGLGLYIAYRYADALGGHLDVADSDEGACLRLRLPKGRERKRCPGGVERGLPR